eukprot:1437101-Heterocapsa_arctica.AAC.1
MPNLSSSIPALASFLLTRGSAVTRSPKARIWAIISALLAFRRARFAFKFARWQVRQQTFMGTRIRRCSRDKATAF